MRLAPQRGGGSGRRGNRVGRLSDVHAAADGASGGRSWSRRCFLGGLGAAALPWLGGCRGDGREDATIAVATNFMPVAEALAASYASDSGQRLRLVGGSTGQLHAQIANGAPFDAFLAADRERPRRLVDAGLAVAGSQFSYAEGRLSLWSADAAFFPRADSRALSEARYAHLAIANPALAPYGRAARETLESLGLWESLAGRIVMGENVGQAFALVATGNAEAGLVATSLLRASAKPAGGWRWDVPRDLHCPVLQDAVLLSRAADNAAARGFLDVLRTAGTRRVLQRAGYRVP